MKAFTEQWSRLRQRVVRGILRALFTAEALGWGESSDTVRTRHHQSGVAADRPSEAAGAGRTRVNAARPGQG